MTKLFLPEPDPYAYRPQRDDLPPWEDEVEFATRRARPWAEQWMGPKLVAAWRRAWPGAQPAIAAGFARAGIAPDVAMTPLWYGRVHPGRKPLAVRVALGDLTLDEAIEQLQSAGLVAPPAQDAG